MSDSKHVFILEVHSNTIKTTVVFSSLKGVYSYLQHVVPFEFTMLSYSVLMNDIVDHRAFETKPYKVAWNTDKSWYAMVSRHHVIDDCMILPSTIQTIYHKND